MLQQGPNILMPLYQGKGMLLHLSVDQLHFLLLEQISTAEKRSNPCNTLSLYCQTLARSKVTMDSITKLQLQLKAISAKLAENIEFLHSGSGSVSVGETLSAVQKEQLTSRADETFKLFQDAEAMLNEFPDRFPTESEQLDELQRLSQENEALGEQLERNRKACGKLPMYLEVTKWYRNVVFQAG